MKATTACVALFASGLGLVVAACAKPPTQTAAPAPAASASATTVAVASPTGPAAKVASDDPLAWLAGSWCAMDEDQLIEETWMLPQAEEAIGMSRSVQSGRQVTFEFMRIAKIEGKDTLFAQPNGEPPTMFTRTDGGADWIRFENPKHDYPTRIEYRKTKSGLHAEIGGPGAENKEEVIPYDYVPCGK
jgi:hypothetical protein